MLEVVPAAKDELKFSTEVPGAPCVMTAGTVTMPTWCAEWWAVALPPRRYAALGVAQARSGWMMWPALDERPHWLAAVTAVMVPITAVIKKMLGWCAEVSQSI